MPLCVDPPTPAPCNFADGQCLVCSSQLSPFNDGFGQDLADRHGPDIGCAPCLDIPQEWFRSSDRKDGRRFLAPDNTGALRRDARGMIGDTIVGDVRPVPRNAKFRRASCWQQVVRDDGGWFVRECFGDNCDCSPPPDTIVDVATETVCDGGASIGEIVPGLYPDCWGYHGYGDANTQASHLYVRDVVNSQSNDFVLTSNPDTLGPMLSRSGDRTHRPCTSDLLSQGRSTVYGNSICSGSLANNDFWWTDIGGGPIPRPSHYTFDSGIRSIFDRIDTAWNIRLGLPSDFPEDMRALPNADAPTIQAKNKVLARMSTTFPTTGESPFDFFRAENASPDGHSSFYGRTWSTPFRVAPSLGLCDDAVGTDAEVAGVFGECFLRRGTILNTSTGEMSRQPIRAHMVLTGITVQIEIVAHRIKPVGGGFVPDEVHPLVGVRVIMDTSIRAFQVDTGGGQARIIRPWYGNENPLRNIPVSIVNGECLARGEQPPGQPGWVDLNDKPKVVNVNGEVVDDIIYYDPNGDVIEPFHQVEWRGSLSPLSDPPSEDVFGESVAFFWPPPGPGSQQSDGYGLLGFAHAFDSFVGGLPTTFGSFPGARSQYFSGGVTLSFHQGLCSFNGVGC